jgi:hypothetical protein
MILVPVEERNPSHDAPDPPSAPSSGEAEALFWEAHARRRRRWRVGLWVAMVVVLAAAVAAVTASVSGGPATGRGAAPLRPPAPFPTGRIPTIAWVDYLGGVHMGDPLTGHQRIVTTAHADPTTPLVSVDGRLFWVGTGCTYEPVSRCPYSFTAGYGVPAVREFVLATRTTWVTAKPSSAPATTPSTSSAALWPVPSLGRRVPNPRKR